MTSDQLKAAINAAPFRPFRLRFGSGQTVDVNHRDFVFLSPSGRTATIFTKAGTFEQGDESQIVDVLLIEAIELLPAKRNGSNGHGKKK